MPPVAATLTCPYCQVEFERPVWQIIDLAVEPELAQRFMGLQIDRAICPSCKRRAFIPVPLLVNDPTQQRLGIYVPDGHKISQDELRETAGDLYRNFLQSQPPEEERPAYLNQAEIMTSREEVVRMIAQHLGYQGMCAAPPPPVQNEGQVR